MGVCYDFVCDDCKKVYDVGKYYNAVYLVPKLLVEHKLCKVRCISDCGDEAPPEEYEYVEIWDNTGTVLKEIDDIEPIKWIIKEFNDWI